MFEFAPFARSTYCLGGGATGTGIALDAASRGLTVALVEREDFGGATSGRSTKLVHGGVRYKNQKNLLIIY
jgi:glycerol-3-phosphate dehydrogenase